jgi:hypothetical protein
MLPVSTEQTTHRALRVPQSASRALIAHSLRPRYAPQMHLPHQSLHGASALRCFIEAASACSMRLRSMVSNIPHQRSGRRIAAVFAKLAMLTGPECSWINHHPYEFRSRTRRSSASVR